MSDSTVISNQLTKAQTEIDNFREALKVLGFPIMLNSPFGFNSPSKENNVLPASWNILTIRMPAPAMALMDAAAISLHPAYSKEGTVTFITSSSLTYRGHNAQYSLPDALVFLSELKDRAAVALNSAGLSTDDASKLVILSMAWQGPTGEAQIILGSRGKYPLADQVDYIRRGYSYHDVYWKEKYEMTFDEWEENRNIPRSYLATIFGER